MINTVVYINDTPIDLDPSTVIAITVQKIDVGDLSGRSVNFTNRIKAPFTKTNDEVFGHARSENTSTSKPYTLLPCKVVQNGVEVIPDGRAILIKVTHDHYEFQVLENTIDVFYNIKGKSIHDISPIPSSSWTASAIDSARLNTSGIFSGVLFWGKPGSIYQVNYFLPCFYYHTFITSILKFSGVIIAGDILSDSRFTDLVIPYPGKEFVYPESFTDARRAKSTNTSSYSYSASAPEDFYRRVLLSAYMFGSANFFGGNNEYIVPSDAGNLNLTITGYVSVSSIVWGASTTLTLKMYKDSGGSITQLATSTISTSPATGGSATVNYTGDLSAAEKIFIAIEDLNASATYTVDANCYLDIICNPTINRSNVYWRVLFPEIKCEDLLSDFFTRFGIIHKLTGNKLILKTLQEIISNPQDSIDWSAKKSSIQEINFSSPYAQQNNIDYSDSEHVNDVELGRGIISIENTKLTKESKLFESVFENSTTETTGGYMVSTIPVYDSSSTSISDFKNEPGLHLLTLKNRTSESSITFDSLARTDYKMAYFIDSSQSKDTGFQYFINQFYLLFTRSLQSNKVITRMYNLTEQDIADYDPHKMVWDGEGYYIVNRISNFIPGQITKVELFKVL